MLLFSAEQRMFRSRLKSAPHQTILVYEDLCNVLGIYSKLAIQNDFVFLRQTEIVGDQVIGQ